MTSSKPSSTCTMGKEAADPSSVGMMTAQDSRKGPTGLAEPLQPAKRLGFVDRFLPFPSLPRYTGSCNVGTLDLEIPVDRPHPIPPLKLLNGKDALRLDTVLMTVFYPTEAKKGSRLSWLKAPKSSTAAGYANFGGVSRWLAVPLALIVAGLARLPAFLNASLAPSSKPRRLVIFSHGLGGSRTAYSQYCGELASRGYVVAAVEHRDGSGPSTFVDAGEKERRHVPFYRDTDISEDTKMPAIEMRKLEVDMRVQEVQEALIQLRRLSSTGTPPQLRRGGRTSSTSRVDWSAWKGALEERNTILSGHSFGGATVIHALRALPAETLSTISHGILLDPWVEPLPSSSSSMSAPLLSLNGPGFSRWTGNFASLRSIVSASADGRSGGLATIGGSVHTSFSDFPTLFPRLSRLMKGGPTIDPRRAIHICVEASVAFVEGAKSLLAEGETLERVPSDKEAMSEPGRLYVHVRPHA